MKLVEALNLLKTPPPAGSRETTVGLACGFTPSHLELFLAAHLRRLDPSRPPKLQTGLFGDCLGNVERLDDPALELESAAVVVEWSDLDPRLGLRRLGGWRVGSLADVVETAAARAAQLAEAITRIAGRTPIALCLPTLPLPPVDYQPPASSGPFDLRLREIVASLAAQTVRAPGVRLVNDQRLAETSPFAERFDVRTELSSGFPYKLGHASAVAELLAGLLRPPAPLKGLITDLDDTLWRGIVGDVGVEAVGWDLDHHAQVHGLYQQLLASLADAGVLIAVASKNDPGVVHEAFQRRDLLLKPEQVFPIEASWGAKSEAVGRILRAWNISADSVAFIDDSPMELAEVEAAHPGLRCFPFPKTDEAGCYALLVQLRELFGKRTLTSDDALRLDSLRRAAEFFGGDGAGRAAAPEHFLEQADAELTLDAAKTSVSPRVLELVNKTNQFNLNGRRYTEREWQTHLDDPDAFLLSASYQDKFGSLGTIAVVTGRLKGDEAVVDQWVMSCRAFSRRIEHRCLEQLFGLTGAVRIEFDYQATPKNGPLRDFLTGFLDASPEPGFQLTLDQFRAQCPPLYHRVQGADSWLIREPA